MSKTSLIDSQWVDIVVPPPPESQMLLWWSISFVLFLIIVICANFLWRRRPRQKFKRKINFLLKTADNTSSKYRLHQLEKTLCQYNQVAQLSYINIRHAQWPAFRKKLQQACYQNKISNPQLTTDLITQAREIFLDSSQ